MHPHNQGAHLVVPGTRYFSIIARGKKSARIYRVYGIPVWYSIHSIQPIVNTNYAGFALAIPTSIMVF